MRRHFEIIQNDPLAVKRERVFALRSMLNFASAGANSELTGRVQSISIQHNLYHQMIRSFVWELELPFILRIAKYEGYPWRQNEAFKEDVAKVSGYRAVPQDVMRAAKKRAKNSAKDMANLKALESQDKGFGEYVGERSEIELYALIESPEVSGALNAVEDIKPDDNGNYQFAEFDAKSHVEEVVGELLEESLSEEELKESLGVKGRMSLDLSFVNYHYLAEFNLAAWDIMKPLNEPIRDLVRDSWEHHAFVLADTLSTFDFKPNRVRINNFLAVENVPLDISEAYLRSFQGLSDTAHEIIEELKVANNDIQQLEVGDNDDQELQFALEVRRERYLMLQDLLQIFADRSQGKPESILCICDCSPCGFLNNPMPII